MAEPGDPTVVELVVDWSGADHAPVLPANQFVTQLSIVEASGEPEGVYLLVGHVAPPVLLGPPEVRAERAEAMKGRVQVTTHGRYFLTRPRLRELIKLLRRAEEQYDMARGQSDGELDH